MPSHFSPLTQELQSCTDAMMQYIRSEMKKVGGRISFARFMECALYAPGLGYYSIGTHKLGKAGDFITAPEISPLFSQCVACQLADILLEMPDSDILELGAGAGTFTKEVLLELERLQALPAHYYILEISADFRHRQQILLKETCPHLYSRIVWLDRLPKTIKGIIFANEVLDALPVHAFHVDQRRVKERCVTLKNDELVWEIVEPLTAELSHTVQPMIDAYTLADGYESEINLWMPHWLATLNDLLERGVILFFDYGYEQREYYQPERYTGTLRCYYQHRCHPNPFFVVGLQDITASVDFTRLAASTMGTSLQLAGYTTQCSFLLACGVEKLIDTSSLSIKQYQQNQALKQLMLPSEMGSLVKAIAFTRNWDTPLRGFSLFDKRREL